MMNVNLIPDTIFNCQICGVTDLLRIPRFMSHNILHEKKDDEIFLYQVVKPSVLDISCTLACTGGPWGGGATVLLSLPFFRNI